MSEEGNKRSGESGRSLAAEMFALCASASLSEDGIREIIQRYGLTPSSNPNVITDYTFFWKACSNELVSVGIIQLLLEYFPAAVNASFAATRNDGSSPLHMACDNKNVTVDIIQLLMDAAPDSVRRVDNYGNMPLHFLCANDMDEKEAIEILKLLLEKCPESIRHTDDKGRLPIHIASGKTPPEFCRVLIEAYPGSEQIFDRMGGLPLHWACMWNTLATVEYLYKLHPDAVNQAFAVHGEYPIRNYPIHVAMMSQKCRNNPLPAVDIVRYLLNCNPNVKLQKIEGKSLLQFACEMKNDDSNIADIEILKLFLEKCPESVRHTDDYGCLPIHYASMEKSPEFCFLLIEAYPGSERISNDDGFLPLHLACRTNTLATVEYFYRIYPDAVNQAVAAHGIRYYPIHLAMMSHICRDNLKPLVDIVKFLLDCDPNVKSQKYQGKSLLQFACMQKNDDSNMAAIEILKMLLEKCPESIRHKDHKGNLPIHLAAGASSPEFCCLLIEAYPGSERISNDDGLLPLHLACRTNTLAIVEYFYNIYPDAVNQATHWGGYPIHWAIIALTNNNSYRRPTATVDIVQFFLDCDPNVKLQKVRGMSLYYYACFCMRNSDLDAALQIVTAIYDAHPEAIEDNSVSSSILNFHQKVQTFINGELVHARQARDHRLMSTPNEEGRLPLHHALQNNVRLGSIKLLVKGNLSAVRYSDNNGALPLHVACEHHSSPRVIQSLLDLNATTLDVVDRDGNTALHYACRGAKFRTIALLLERHDAISVSKRNAQMKLPIDLLWESDKVEDRESVGYLDSVFRLLKAYPEMLMNIEMQMQQMASEVGKKRKFGAV